MIGQYILCVQLEMESFLRTMTMSGSFDQTASSMACESSLIVHEWKQFRIRLGADCPGAEIGSLRAWTR